MRKNDKGFTLVELLAVIVILGLLMAIAIPSVTKYITKSRVKTLVSSVEEYVNSVVTQVNNGEYRFSDSTKVYAIPIECISLEKGGQSPFGNWIQANEAYWAYVLVHYDNANYNYEYGFTFKDDAGYGLYPTRINSITSSMIKTGYDELVQPKDGLAINFASIDDWNGFSNIKSTTELVVLEAESDGVTGDGQNTCTLSQKGDNYEEIENQKAIKESNKLYKMIVNQAVPDNQSSEFVSNGTGIIFSEIASDTNGKGIYLLSSSKNDKYPIAYYRGNVTNNFVIFGDFCWRIIRTTETGGVKLIYNGRPNGSNQCLATGTDLYVAKSKYAESSSSEIYSGYMYANDGETENKNDSSIKIVIDEWYKNNMKSYENYIEDTIWCNDRSKTNSSWNALSRLKSGKPTLTCSDSRDRFTVSKNNGNGNLTYPVGMITADEITYAGGLVEVANTNYYLHIGVSTWSMTPYGVNKAFYPNSKGVLNRNSYTYEAGVRPMISLKNTVIYVDGDGTSLSPYIVENN